MSPSSTLPSGSQPYDPNKPLPEDQRTGNWSEDFSRAWSKISLRKDLESLGQIPCARNSLLYGIGSGAGMGALRFLSAGPRSAASWALGTCGIVTYASWIICRRDRAEELKMMRMIVEKYPERNAQAVKERYEAAMAAKQSGETKKEE